MNNRVLIHFVDPNARARAQCSRIALALGHHAEVYADIEELCRRPPQRGILVVRDDRQSGGIKVAIQRLTDSGLCLPVVAMDEAPAVDRIVAAIKGGALDFLTLPLVPERLHHMLVSIESEADTYAAARRRGLAARNLIDHLSARERQVLDSLARGSTNKAMAQELQISARTVEIHRANMMAKLGAQHPADAVRLRFEASLR